MTFHRQLLGGCLSVMAALLVGSCGSNDSDEGCLPTDPTCNPPVAGQIALKIVTPHLDDRAVVLTISGEFTVARPITGYQMFQSATANTFIIISTGVMAWSSRVLTLDVPDIKRRTSYTATIIEVAASDYVLRSNLSGYQTSFEEVS